MTTWFISRHAGALEWAARRRFEVDRIAPHLDIAAVAPGDTVIGTLPPDLAAAVCACGAKYLHLSVALPIAARGQELSADELQCYGAKLVRIEAHIIEEPP